MPNVKYRGITGTCYNGATKILGLKDLVVTDSMTLIGVEDHDSGGYGEELGTFAKVTITANIWYLGDSVTGVQETGQAALRTAKNAQTILTIKIRPAGDGTGKAEEQYPVRVAEFTLGQPTAGAQPFDVKFAGAGAPTITTQP